MSEKRGGKRVGAGRKGKYKEPTIPMRVPESKVKLIENAKKQEEIKEKIRNIFNELDDDEKRLTLCS